MTNVIYGEDIDDSSLKELLFYKISKEDKDKELRNKESMLKFLISKVKSTDKEAE